MQKTANLLKGGAIAGGTLVVVVVIGLVIYELATFSYKAFATTDLPGVWQTEVTLEDGGLTEVKFHIEGNALDELNSGTLILEDASSSESRTLAIDTDEERGMDFFAFDFTAGGEGTPSPLITISGEQNYDKLEGTLVTKGESVPFEATKRAGEG